MTTPAPRALIRIAGSDHRSFLQGLVTNDVGKVDHGAVYAAILTPQGKYLADFLMVPDGDGILLDMDARLADGLMQRLSMYKLRADVSITRDPRQVAQGVGDRPEGAFDDPRDPALGWRSYGQDTATLPDWTDRRVAAIVPEFGTELGPDSYILEMGFERLGGVDFKKGCYVGQEVTARMKHKTELRKGLTRVTLTGDCAPGTPIVSGGKTAGEVHSIAGAKALAYVRFERLGTDAMAGGAQVARDPGA